MCLNNADEMKIVLLFGLCIPVMSSFPYSALHIIRIHSIQLKMPPVRLPGQCRLAYQIHGIADGAWRIPKTMANPEMLQTMQNSISSIAGMSGGGRLLGSSGNRRATG